MIRARFLFLLLAVTAGLLLWSPGCDELTTETIEVTIAGHPTADFTYNPDAGCLSPDSLVVTFQDASSGPVERWLWNFGDGTLDTLWLDSGDDGGTTHTYRTEGSFTVVLTVFDTLDGSDAESKRRAVIIGTAIDSMTVSDTLICPGTEVTFTAYDPMGVDTWRWSFGDNTTTTDSGLVQTHTYVDRGIYVCSLKVTGECGTTVIRDTIHVVGCAEPMFTADPHEACAPATINFVDQTPAVTDSVGDSLEIVGTVIQWHWDYGNGTSETSTSATDTMEASYSDPGSYGVTLTTTTDSGGVSSYTDSILITPEVVAAFGATPVTACEVANRQYVVGFTDSSVGATAWSWTFGDGFSSDLQNPYHAYENPGTYSVQLTVNGPCGAEATTLPNLIEYSDQLNEITLTASTDSAAIADSVVFYDVSPAAAVVHRIWDFGDGTSNTFTGAEVFHRYDSVDVFWVVLARYNTCDTLLDSVQVQITSGAK